MSDLETIGDSSILMKVLKFKYEWKIYNFSSFTEKNSMYKSDKLYLFDSAWFLTVIPNYHESFLKYVSVALHRHSSAYPAKTDISLGIKIMSQIIVNENKGTHIFNDKNRVWICSKFLDESKLQRKKSIFIPADILTIVCSIEIKNPPVLPTRYDSQLSEDFKNLYNSKENADVVLNVREKIYYVHKAILGARCPVLAAMFKNDMEENRTEIVNISDCDPKAFKIFLIFLYSGSTAFTMCNVCELYKIADKYAALELKLMCVDIMSKNLSVENFCEILVLSDQFNEAKLSKAVQRYFYENFEKIVSSENWEEVLQNNFRPANNLLKTLAPKIKMV